MRALLAISAVALALAGAGCRCPLLWDECRIASLDCGRGRTIDLYVDSFCDVGALVSYEVRGGGRVVAPKTLTRVAFRCEDWSEGTDPGSYRLIAEDTGDLFAVTFDGEGEEIVALVFDFETGKGVPRTLPHPGVREIPPDLLDRLGLSAQDS